MGAPHPALAALNNLSLAEVEEMDADELQRFESACHHWEALARRERRSRDLRQIKQK